MRNPKRKTHTKKRVQYDIFNKLLIKETRDSPPETCKHFIPMYSTHMEYGRLCENLNEIITILSLQIFICPYDLWT